jgi:Polyketide cyclase / dehydrase and lipid transport
VAITESIEISRSPRDVFAYIDDLAKHGEWQEQVVSAKVEGAGPTGVGTRSTETRKIGGRAQEMTYEVTEHEPPHAFAFRGVDGAVRAIGRATIEPLDGGARSRVTLELDFEGHGMGKLMLPLVRSQAGKQVARDQAALKQRLESGTSAA